MKKSSLLKKTLVFFLIASCILIAAACLQALKVSYSKYILAAGAILQLVVITWMARKSAGVKSGNYVKE